ncbi:ABC transporter substrate-binding protein [Timonella senegalensis]|uniref:ABC transporter substrate-binding protein n=1 Tax=Timonella senegalensis TaxID=1465825 RepID=UPI002FDE9708
MFNSPITRRIFAVAAAATLAFGLTACSPEGSSEPAPAAASGGDLTLAIAGGNLENGHMDPHSSQLDVSAYVTRNVFDSLVALDVTGEIKPWLAKSWTVSEDGLTYVFELRDDVTFTDGEKFNAAAAVKNFEHITAEETASAQSRDMIGGDLFKGAKATGEYELTLTLEAPFAPLLNNLSTAFVGFYSPKVLSTATQDQLKAGGPEVTVGTGPFKLTAYSPKQELDFAPNKDYVWGPEVSTAEGAPVQAGAPKLDSLKIRIVPEESARVGALQSGDAQIAIDLTPTGTAQLSGAHVNVAPSPGMPYSMYLNWSHGVFKDIKVRQAFQQGFDLDAAVGAAYSGDYQRPWSILSPSTPKSYDSSLENAWPFDADKANALLDEAGWTERDAEGYRTKDGERLSAEWLSWLPFPDEKQALVNFMIDDLKKIGFELKHQAIEGAEYQARYADSDGNMILDFDATDWSFASLDADILRQHLHTQGYQNASTISDPALDALLEQAQAATDANVREGLYKQVQQWNVKNVGIIPLTLSQFTTASLPSVKGLAYDSYGWPLLAGVTVEK